LELPYLDFENLESVGAFKTPSLRNIEKTAPYMHDGRMDNLKDIIKFYDELKDTPAMGHREESLAPLDLSSEEQGALERFLKTLTSPVLDLSS
jgi:cytochrome c peroxidase